MMYSDMQRSGYNLREVERLSNKIAEERALVQNIKRHRNDAEKNYLRAKLSGDPAAIYKAVIELRNADGVIATLERSIDRHNEQRIAKYYNIRTIK